MNVDCDDFKMYAISTRAASQKEKQRDIANKPIDKVKWNLESHLSKRSQEKRKRRKLHIGHLGNKYQGGKPKHVITLNIYSLSTSTERQRLSQ